MARRSNPKGRKIASLKRRKAVSGPKRRFVVFCEGKNTEPAYLKALKRICSSTIIDVQIHPGVGVPHTIATKAVELAESQGISRRRRLKKNSFEEHDQVWAVFDKDEHPKYEEAVERCESKGIGVGRSNPCFELWLILHDGEYNKENNRHKVQSDFASMHPAYKLRAGKIPDCDELVARVENAEERAEAQLSLREGEDRPFGNPSTTVGKLTRAIREADRLAKRPS